MLSTVFFIINRIAPLKMRHWFNFIWPVISRNCDEMWTHFSASCHLLHTLRTQILSPVFIFPFCFSVDVSVDFGYKHLMLLFSKAWIQEYKPFSQWFATTLNTSAKTKQQQHDGSKMQSLINHYQSHDETAQAQTAERCPSRTLRGKTVQRSGCTCSVCLHMGL